MPLLDPLTLAISFVFGGIGFVAFRYGRRMELFPPLVIGLALMVYPLFVASTVWLVAIGAALTLCLWLFRE